MWSIGMDFDTEKFINEIRVRPAIWNSKCPEYVDRELKIQAWNDLVEEYAGDEELSREERKKLCLHFQKKWRNIRDCFVKTHKAKLKNKKITYSFYDNLLFLTETLSVGNNVISVHGNDVISNNVITVDGIKNEMVHNIQVDPLSVVASVLKRKRRRAENSESGDSEVSNKKEKTQEKEDTHMEEDEDRMFFLSLVKEFGKIPEHLRIQAKIDLLKVIKDAQFPNWAGHVVPESSQYQY